MKLSNIRGYKTELKPNNKQRTLFLKAVGTARFAHNWGLERKQAAMTINQLPIPRIKVPTAIDLHKELNKLKSDKFGWMYDVSKCAPQEALRNLDVAFENFFKHNTGYPNFKSRKDGTSFTLTGAIKVFNDRIQLPTFGKIRLKEKNYIPSDKHILSATVSQKAGRWFVSVQTKEEIDVPDTNHGDVIGIDLGISTLATCSDGAEYQLPIRELQKIENKVSKLNKELSRKKKESSNRKKLILKLQKAYVDLTNLRKDFLHKLTTKLTRTKSVIVLETLKIGNMVKNHKLSRAIHRMGWSIFRTMLEYKAKLYGCLIIDAPANYASTKLCSRCEWKNEAMTLADRTFKCNSCGLVIGRDYNASLNLKKLAASSVESNKRLLERKALVPVSAGTNLSLMNQELNTVLGRNVLNG